MLRAILESAVAGIIVMDADGTMVNVNPSVERMFGYSTGEMIGHNVSMLMPQPHRSAHDGYLRRYHDTGERRIIGIGREVHGQRKDGSLFPLHLSVGEFSKDGRRHFTGVLIDLSAEKMAEERFRRQRALFEAIFANLPDPVLIANMERAAQLINPAFSRVFGYRAEEIVGSSTAIIYENIADVDKEPPWRAFNAQSTGPGPRPQLINFRRKNGETFPGLSMRSVVLDRESREIGYLCVIRDISEDVRREAVLMKAQRMEAVGQLTGGVAHDFNNILTVIIGNLELLEPKLEGELAQSLAKEAMEASEMGARLTARLLTFARRAHLEKRKINLNEFVLGLTELLRRIIGEDIDLSTSLAGDLWLTEADPSQFENAVVNLAINSRDAMPNGGRIVFETRNVSLDAEAVSLVPGLAAGDYVLLAVSDSGHGMTPEVRARAFEPFFSTKGPGRGSGLGLATIYGFVRQSGGHVTIYSEVGKGTTVNIYLPRTLPAEAPADASVRSAMPGGRGEHVLVVEDEERVRRLTSSRLRSLGYRVTEAANGAEARALLDGGLKVDLVLTDLVMPGGMSGMDLLRHVRAAHPGTRILLTSGYAEELINGDAVAAHGVRILRKPYRQEVLAAALREVLG
jgi:PAS domain S-box-containing protein